MKNRSLPIVLTIVVLTAGLFLSSCASLDQRVRIAPLPANLPVSASSSLYVDGRTIGAPDLSVVKDFTFDKGFSAKLKQKEVELVLSDDLARIAQEAGGNAIINLKIGFLSLGEGDLVLIWLERYAGLFSLGAGAVYIAQPFTPPGQSPSSSGTIAGIAMAGAGAALIGGSFLHESLGSAGYSFRISGTVVRY